MSVMFVGPSGEPVVGDGPDTASRKERKTMRLIDADALVEAMLEARREETDTMLRLVRFIYAQPTIEPKTGRWIIEDKYKDYRTERCSVCGFVANRSYIQDIWHFCPNCGARMESEE